MTVVSKIKKHHTITLLFILIPIWLLGISNYYFASSSFIYVEPLLTSERQWVGSSDGILMAVAMSVTVIVLWVAGIYTDRLDRCINRFKNAAVSGSKFIRENPKKVLLHVGILFSIAILALLLEIIFSFGAPLLSFTFIVRVVFFMTVGLSAYCIYMFRKRPEALFLSLSLLIGALYIVAQPIKWFAWDNGIHYAFAVEESFIRNVSVTRADYLLANVAENFSFFAYLDYLGIENEFSWLRSQDDATLYTFIKGTDSFAVADFREHMLYIRLAYIPTGLAIFIGRSLALAPLLILKLGVMANHILYTLLVYFALKRLNSGKYIMAVIAMFPTAFVLSTTYGTDHWVIGFLMLGFAYFFHEMQNPDTKISRSSLLIMVGSFFMGMSPKAVYVPLMLILYLVKREKFKTKEGYRSYLICISCLIIFITASFAVPFLTDGAMREGDFRGGYGVSGLDQAMFILQNPLTYTGILLNFLAFHLNPLAVNYVTFFAYLQESSFFYLVWILVVFVAITDRNEKDMFSSSIKSKVIMAVLVFLTAALYSTAMYVGFTEVGLSTILGVQGRYKLPFLFPFFYVIGSFISKNKINKTVYSCAVFGIMSFVLLVGAWEQFIPHELW